jgi:hypothetical protein
LKTKYGHDTEAIMANCQNIVFLTSRELELLRYISELCGEDAYGKRLFTTSDLQHFSKEEGEALVMHQRNAPIFTSLPDIDDYRFENTKPAPLKARKASPENDFDVDAFGLGVLQSLGVDGKIIDCNDLILRQKYDEGYNAGLVKGAQDERLKVLEGVAKIYKKYHRDVDIVNKVMGQLTSIEDAHFRSLTN